MSYDGLEIDMLSLGNADSILVTRWNNGLAERVLIDGGEQSSAPVVRSFLRGQGISYLDHVVCSHYHDDHAAGLIELLKDNTLAVGRLWTHLELNHIDVQSIINQAKKYPNLKEANVIMESLETHVSLVQTALDRKIPLSEPFKGQNIGFLTVCGPSVDFYKEIIAEMANENYYSSKSTGTAVILKLLEDHADKSSDSLLDNPKTDPLNNTSTILATSIGDDVYVFTADAGAEALAAAVRDYQITGCKWMQIPHHGSRRNITQGLIEAFSPQTAFVSAVGNKKHPRRAVVNAFKNQGAKVYSTHYPNGGHLRQPVGSVPERAGHISATPLWEAK